MFLKFLEAAAVFVGLTGQVNSDLRYGGKKIAQSTFYPSFPSGETFDVYCGGAGVCITSKNGIYGGGAMYYGLNEEPIITSTQNGFRAIFPYQLGDFEIAQNLSCDLLIQPPRSISLGDFAIVAGDPSNDWSSRAPKVFSWARIPLIKCEVWEFGELFQELQNDLTNADERTVTTLGDIDNQKS